MADRKNERRGLGRGLSALMADVRASEAPADQPGQAARAPGTLPVEKLMPNPGQPRRDFAPGALDELAASIREKGVLQPLIVRPAADKPGSYEIVAGERRWRAAQMAQQHEVPVLIRDLSDTEVLEIAIIENVQRADLNPVEEAMGYRQLVEKFGHTQEHLSEAMGKSRSHIANLMRLLQLPQEVLSYLREGKLTAGHARALITSDNPVDLARKAITGGLSVRQVENMARKSGTKQRRPRGEQAEKDADTRILEQDLSANLGMSVVVDHHPGGEGRLIIRYKTMEQLDQLCHVLSTGR